MPDEVNSPDGQMRETNQPLLSQFKDRIRFGAHMIEAHHYPSVADNAIEMISFFLG